MKLALTTAGLALWATLSAAQAVEVSGVTLPPSLTMQEKDLQLTGCATREQFFMDVYVIGLYLPQAEMSRQEILAQDTPKAVRLHIVYDGTVPDDVPDSWREPLQEMADQDLQRTLKNIYEQFESGDQITIKYAPGMGSVVLINGEQVRETDSHELMQALLTLWIGDQAVSDNIQRLLLQGQCKGGSGGLL